MPTVIPKLSKLKIYSKSNRHLHLEANELVQTSMLTNFSLEGALNTTQNLQTHLGQTSIL